MPTMNTTLGPVEVFAVEPGSLIVLRDVYLPEPGLGESLDEGGMDLLVSELARVSGHDRFLILNIATDSSAEVIGPADLKARLREALAEAD